jgi:radical SAM protein with 4Fe4S-binding SPASM domain
MNDTKGIYIKENSFAGLSLNKDHTYNIDNMVVSLKEKLPTISRKKRDIILRVISDLELCSRGSCTDLFSILPHVNEELQRIKEENIVDYIYYRYRYDIFPKTQEVDEYPPVIQIEPSSSCNYRCVFCFQTDKKLTTRQNGHMGQMEMQLFKDIVDQIENNVFSITLASRGEPLINRDIGKMLNYTKNKFLAIKLNTNASLLNDDLSRDILESGINTLVFSADASGEPLYSKLRVNGKFENIIKNIKRFNEIRNSEYSKSNIITRVAGVKFDDEQNMEDMESVWGKLVDQIAFVKYNPWENSYARSENNIKSPCSDLWRRMFIWWDGRCNPCDVDYLSKLETGRIQDKTISDIWTGDRYAYIRKKHQQKQRNHFDPCKRCTQV